MCALLCRAETKIGGSVLEPIHYILLLDEVKCLILQGLSRQPYLHDLSPQPYLQLQLGHLAGRISSLGPTTLSTITTGSPCQTHKVTGALSSTVKNKGSRMHILWTHALITSSCSISTITLKLELNLVLPSGLNELIFLSFVFF